MKRSAILLPALAVAVQGVPALTSVPRLRRAVSPALAGLSRKRHVALTYDDGPDPLSTPHFLDLLSSHDRFATFFLLGEHAARHPGLVRQMADRGHEIAVHGWDHRCLAAKRPGTLRGELARTRDLIEEIAGERPVWYRPPYGVLTTEGMFAARAAGLRTVLWSAWGRDWTASATSESIVTSVRRGLKPGGTVLLHDTDRTSAPNSWMRTLDASSVLLTQWADGQVPVGALNNHWR